LIDGKLSQELFSTKKALTAYLIHIFFMLQAWDRELHFSMVDGDFKKFEGKWSVKSGTR